ncbi:hypothetical protein CYMTET_9936 [Cymbomonas tetramitiformis]|uniref:VCBS repeat-containing protein n=1 Tax=Cymbomonas tetramitiformis TaxID=36881 RepID=A0AAE0GQN0_9CHLO|nr:hypothetical protein CYMTET_9936 [Cymbomonas tetramitiformis]
MRDYFAGAKQVEENPGLCGDVPDDVTVYINTSGTSLGQSCPGSPTRSPTTKSGFSIRVISTLADDASLVYAADVDGDGYIDVLSASTNDDKIAWSSAPWSMVQYPVYRADVDGDRDIDVLSASFEDATIAWYANDGSGGFGSQQVISTLADGARSVYAADVDGDGDMDVLSASRDDDKIACGVGLARVHLDPSIHCLDGSGKEVL